MLNLEPEKTQSLNEIEKDIYQCLLEVLSRQKNLYIYLGPFYQRIIERSNGRLSTDLLDKHLDNAKDICIKEGLLIENRVFFTEEGDLEIEKDSLEIFDEVGILYHPESGEVVKEPEQHIIRVFQTPKRKAA